jgi:hypothetical protein
VAGPGTNIAASTTNTNANYYPIFVSTTGVNTTPYANTNFYINPSTNILNTTAVQAQYADLAENYTSDAEYTPGTVVIFGGECEITTTVRFADSRVAGAVSTAPAYLMNNQQIGLPIALRGRIPLRVIGLVAKGDLLVTGTVPGTAVSVGSDTSYGVAIFAKSIEDHASQDEKVITAVIL